MNRIVLAGAALAFGISAAAVAQADSMTANRESMTAMMHRGMHGDGGHGAMHDDDEDGARGDQNPASLAFRGVNEKMHRDMNSPSPATPMPTSCAR